MSRGSKLTSHDKRRVNLFVSHEQETAVSLTSLPIAQRSPLSLRALSALSPYFSALAFLAYSFSFFAHSPTHSFLIDILSLYQVTGVEETLGG